MYIYVHVYMLRIYISHSKIYIFTTPKMFIYVQ